jgi:AraC-like DNA-binding protein
VLQTEVMQPVARYREFDPCPPLRDYVRCFFTFTVPAETDEPRRPIRRELLYCAPGSYTTPLFADSQVSISFSFGEGYRVDGLWDQAEAKHCGQVIGAMSAAHPAAHGERIIEVGAYFRPVRAKCFFGIPACELTDLILPLSDFWGASSESLETNIAEAKTDEQRVRQLERALLQRVTVSSGHRSAVNLDAMAEFVRQRRGAVNVAELADSAGVSRQHLRRIFQKEVGMPPKLFCRLARFRAALACVARHVTDDGAGLAAELGYVDQSHMIAEFREFSGLTPKPLMLHQRVHPFMDLTAVTDETSGRARFRRTGPSC